jgi:ubiquinone/menaquinone biosynthesis C-methylase UbiE
MANPDPGSELSELPEDPEVREKLLHWNQERSERWERAVAAGDRAELRTLYQELGEFLQGEARDRPEGRAVLSHEITNALIRRIADTTHGKRVLDVGCGPTPVATMAFAANGNQVVGVEIAPALAARARDEAAAFPTARFAVGDAERLPFADASFDLATCDDTIEHVVDPQAALDELARVVKPGGRLLLISPNHGAVHVIVTKLRERIRGRVHPRRWYYITDSHVLEFRWRELHRLLRDHWRLEKPYPMDWGGAMVGWKGRLASRLVRIGPFWRVSSILIVVLRRTGR